MNVSHKGLAEGRWQKMSVVEQMANIGSEVSRALNWQKKDNKEYTDKAVHRALELLCLTLAGKHSFARYKEIARVREAVVDYFYGENSFKSSEKLWRNYFDHFAYALKR